MVFYSLHTCPGDCHGKVPGWRVACFFIRPSYMIYASPSPGAPSPHSPYPLTLGPLNLLSLLNLLSASLDLLYILWNLGHGLKGTSNLLGLPYYISGHLELTARVSFALFYFQVFILNRERNISTFLSRIS